MKLTNYLRDSFVLSVSNNIPKVKWPTEEQLQAEALKKMSPRVKALYKDETLRNALKTDRGYINGFGHIRIVVGDVTLADLLKPYRDAEEARRQVLKKIEGVAYGCTTLKQLQEALPELKKHMPSEKTGVSSNLPVPAGLISELKAVGFKE